MTDLIVQNFNYNGIVIQRRTDGFVNLTQMCAAGGKRIDNYTRLKQTQEYVRVLGQELGCEVMETVLGGNKPGTWGHPKLAEHLRRWIDSTPSKSTSKIFEVSVQTALALELGGVTEVKIQTGRVDVLTDSEVIEVKDISDWKDAVGQALIYALEFPGRKPRIHLYGKSSDQFRYMICSYCKKLKVAVSFEK